MVQYSEKRGKILRLAKSIYFDVVCSEGPIAFFNPVIPTQNFGQSRNPAGYFWHPPPVHTFNPESRVSNRENPESRGLNKGYPGSRKVLL